eukprot:UN04402
MNVVVLFSKLLFPTTTSSSSHHIATPIHTIRSIFVIITVSRP